MAGAKDQTTGGWWCVANNSKPANNDCCRNSLILLRDRLLILEGCCCLYCAVSDSPSLAATGRSWQRKNLINLCQLAITHHANIEVCFYST